ncbi:Mu homology domain-containing protein [Chytriomyces cf. hyalinus JEL632]|nr:Mu homology domain-containing protein [Chytriomyces cf. hyalinus JEL632]
MDAFFVLSATSSGTPLIEKHCRGDSSAAARKALSLFWHQVSRSGMRTVPVAADSLASVIAPNTINLNAINVGSLASTASAAAVSAAATTTAAAASALNSLSNAIPSLSNLAASIPTVEQPSLGSASNAFYIGGDGGVIVNETNVFDITPLASTDEFYLVHIQRNGLFFVGLFQEEVQPLVIVEFLQRMVDILIEYFGEISEIIIKEHFVFVYELLEEMLDHGHPYITEPAILKDMVPPPSLLASMMNAVSLSGTAVQHVPQASFSQVPWRASNIRYAKNEFYMDVIESLNVIQDRNGNIITGNVTGEIRCSSRLSGMPDLTLNFLNPKMFEDLMTSFHPCVRYFRFEKERVVSFVPPDGDFKLMDYVIPMSNSQHLPVQIKPQINLTKAGGKLSISVHPRSTGGKPLDQVIVTISLPPQVTGAQMNGSVGSVQYDQNARKIRWIIAKIQPDAPAPQLTGTLTTEAVTALAEEKFVSPPPGAEEDGEGAGSKKKKKDKKKGKNATSRAASGTDQLSVTPLVDIAVEFKVAMHTASGIKIDQLNVLGEMYVPFKGVRAFCRSGKYHIRV